MKPTLVQFGALSGTKSHPTKSLSFFLLFASLLSAAISSTSVSTLQMVISTSHSSGTVSSVHSVMSWSRAFVHCSSVSTVVGGGSGGIDSGGGSCGTPVGAVSLLSVLSAFVLGPGASSSVVCSCCFSLSSFCPAEAPLGGGLGGGLALGLVFSWQCSAVWMMALVSFQGVILPLDASVPCVPGGGSGGGRWCGCSCGLELFPWGCVVLCFLCRNLVIV